MINFLFKCPYKKIIKLRRGTNNFVLNSFKQCKFTTVNSKDNDNDQPNNYNILTNEKEFEKYLLNFPSAKVFIKSLSLSNPVNMKLFNFIQTSEFLKGNFYILNGMFIEAENIFKDLKIFLRNSGLISHKLYSVVLKRLAISQLRQNKISEGLLELENVYEFSKTQSYKERLNSKLDLLKAYIHYDPGKVHY
jgi:hypothetical protein